ncbi:MAG: electron transport complex subunit RsxD [Pseudomonadota bacterium]
MRFPTYSSPHRGHERTTTRVMGEVLLALIPGLAAMTWYFGWGVLINLVIATAAALGLEALALRWRGRPVRPALADLSAVVTAWLFALSVPPLLPWWLTVLGMAFAIVIVKQLYGGLGYNPFNPAMGAYVFLLISYPVPMTAWLPPSVLAEHQLSLGQTLTAVFTSTLPQGLTWDAITMATPLDEMRTKLEMNQMISEIRESPLWGDYGGRGWEWVGNWFLVGGVFLLWRRVITWHIPVSFLLTLLVTAGLFWAMEPEAHPYPAFHLFSGGAILGAFFIATDPVSACTTPRGQIIYGAFIGLLVFIIRSWGGYPDAVAFAVLLMNMAVPTIDYYTQPRVLGQQDEDR